MIPALITKKAVVQLLTETIKIDKTGEIKNENASEQPGNDDGTGRFLF